ncbi:MAG: alpha/beta fold hydrolase [Erysipelotrichaceae bacterium]|nr:alpha/beta fold hydrolase [Erysipelotrichaceae bacterium]
MERNLTVKSPSDGLELDVLEILPDNSEVVGIVQIAHGMQEHKERYRDFMNFLASKGYAVVCADHRGHGKSIQNPEDLGYFYDESGDAIVNDLNAVQENLRQQYPDVPVFLIAHSMGTLVARKYIQSFDDRISALVLSGPVYKNPAAKLGKMLIRIIRTFKGDRHISKFVANLIEGSFDKGIAGEQKNRWLSYNEENVERFNADPICGKPFTLNGYANLLQLLIDCYSTKGWAMKNPQLPIFFVAGAEDPVIGNANQFEKMQQFLKERGYQHVEGKLYEKMRHEILNETDRQRVYEDLYTFLEAHR